MTGDGVADIVEASGRAKVGGVSQAGRLHVFDGPSLGLLKTIDNPEPAPDERFGEGLLAADLDLDGVTDIVVSDVKNHYFVLKSPLAVSEIVEHSKPPSPNPSLQETAFGYFFLAQDVNGDGLVDIVISDIFEGDSMGCSPLGSDGTLYVALGPYYSSYLRFVNPIGECGDVYGWAVFAADVDGDGSNELIAGSLATDAAGVQNSGRVIIAAVK